MVYCPDITFVHQSQKDFTSLKKRSNREQCGNKIARPLNAFMIYRSERKALFGSRLHSSQISKLVGEMWRNEPDTIKAIYERRAEKMKLEHSMKYPGYRYLPESKRKNQIKEQNSSCSVEDLSRVESSSAIIASTEPSSANILSAENLTDPVVPMLVDQTADTTALPSAMLNAADILPEWSNMDTITLSNNELCNELQFETDLERLVSYYVSATSSRDLAHL